MFLTLPLTSVSLHLSDTPYDPFSLRQNTMKIGPGVQCHIDLCVIKSKFLSLNQMPGVRKLNKTDL